QPNAALGVAAAGAGLVLLAYRRRRLVVPFAALCGLIGFATLLEHLSGIDFGVDATLTFGRPWGGAATVAPGRMGPPASVALSLLGIGLLASLGGRPARQAAAVLGLLVLVLGVHPFIGYLFGADPLYTVARATAIALQTATMIVALGVGLMAALPDSQPMRTLLEPSGAGLLARRALPFVIVVPVVLGLLVLRARETGWFDRGLSFAVLVLALIITMSAVLWWCVRAVSAHERALAAAVRTVGENEARFRRLADAMPQIVYVLDADGEVSFINQQWRTYTGQASAAAGNLAFGVHPDDLPALVQAWDRARLAGVEYAAEFRLRGGADGSYRWFLSRVVPIRDEAGRVVRWYGTSTDIHDQKLAETALRESERRFREFADTAPAMLWVTGPDGACTFRSRGWSEFSGQSEAEALGFGWLETVHPEDREDSRRELLSAVARGEAFTLEHRVRRADGEYRWVISAGRPRLGSTGEPAGYSASVIDIHDRKQAEEQLRQAAKMQAIGRLAGGVAHDFNNQLNAVGGFADFVARDPGLGARARHDLQEILKAVERMAGLTRQLLAFSRQQVLQPETLQLNAAVLDGSALLQRLIGSHIEMSLDLTADPTWVRVDRAQLLQVLMNLAINARDAMPDGGRLQIRTGRWDVTRRDPGDTTAEAVTSGPYVLLSVSDTGAGIREKDLPHVFEPFFTTKDQGQGTGLGLATVHGIVTQSQGRVTVESRPGEGAKFTVLFPAVAGASDVETMPAGRRGVASREARILVVDDEDAVRAVVSRVLEEEGYTVSQARDGREALESLARNGRVDLVLTDVVMPGLGARELVERLGAEYPGLPVIWMSGYPRDAAFGDGGPTGAHAFLQKPIPQDVLVHTVEGVLGRSGREP
ncbi:MAG TPA: PAS domain S-box protein, partial [Gemmatimonadales bacterium]|nr:PAS domain S-box protein [Gemmatimonadales bacterium]